MHYEIWEMSLQEATDAARGLSLSVAAHATRRQRGLLFAEPSAINPPHWVLDEGPTGARHPMRAYVRLTAAEARCIADMPLIESVKAIRALSRQQAQDARAARRAEEALRRD